MSLMNHVIVDVLRSGCSVNHDAPSRSQKEIIAKQFAEILQKEYPLLFNVLESLHYALTLFLVLINLGTLYHVLLKGMTREYMWQKALLQICFLDWFIQIVFYQAFEV